MNDQKAENKKKLKLRVSYGIVIIMLIPTIATFSQKTERLFKNEFCVGAKVGINLTKWSGGNVDEWRSDSDRELKRITQMNFGIIMQYSFNRHLSINSELLFNQKGSKWQDIDFNELWFDLHLNYLDIVILPRFSLGGSKIRGFGCLGPSIGYLLYGKMNYIKVTSVNGQLVSSENEKMRLFLNDENSDPEVENFLNRFDIEVLMGAGIEYLLTSGKISLEFRWGRGLNNTMTRDSDYTGYNDIISFSISYLLPIEKNRD